MRENVIAEKSMLFAVRVVRLYQHLTDVKHEFVMAKQVLRSGQLLGKGRDLQPVRWRHLPGAGARRSRLGRRG